MTRVEKAFQEIKNYSLEQLQELCVIGSQSTKSIDKDRARAASYLLNETKKLNRSIKNKEHMLWTYKEAEIVIDQLPDRMKMCYEFFNDDALCCEGDLGCDDICEDKDFHTLNHVVPYRNIICTKCPYGRMMKITKDFEKSIMGLSLESAFVARNNFIEDTFKDIPKDDYRKLFLDS